jgi:hypothetical protein
MPRKPLFQGLVFEDQSGEPAQVIYVGAEPCYVIDDAGFHRHIPAEQIDRQVLSFLKGQIEGNEGLLVDQTAKMVGANDIFSRAMLENQFKNLDKQFDTLIENGIPEEGLAYMGMMGFRIFVDLHGELVRVEQPGQIDPGDSPGEE